MTDNNTISDSKIRYGKFPSRWNWGFNFLSDGHKYVIERAGKFHHVCDPGFATLIPWVDRIAYAVDVREICLVINPQHGTTADNVRVRLAGNLYVKFTDPKKAAYGAEKPIYAVAQFAESVMRTSVGSFMLDKLFSERHALNLAIREEMEKGAQEWGCQVIRFEVTDLVPADQHVTDSMNKQSVAERDRRQLTITAEAHKRETELKSEAYRFKQQAEAEGDAQKIRLNADARAYEVERQAQAEATRVRLNAEAKAYEMMQQADAESKRIQMIGQALQETGPNTAQMLLSQQYINELGKFAGKGTTLILPQTMSDLGSVIATGMASFKAITSSQSDSD